MMQLAVSTKELPAVNDRLIALCVGGILIVVGVVLMWAHAKAWRLQKNDPQLDFDDRSHFYARYRRRIQTSGMIALLGLLIPLGDALLHPKVAPLWATLYWIVVLLLVGWVIVMGLGDWTSTLAHSRASLARIRQKQRELEQQVSQMRRRGSNGHKLSD